MYDIPKIIYSRYKSICFHPSILPRHRGASALSWTLIEGDSRGGFTIFWADEGLDTGPILLQRECDVGENDTLDVVYRDFIMPEGVKVKHESVTYHPYLKPIPPDDV